MNQTCLDFKGREIDSAPQIKLSSTKTMIESLGRYIESVKLAGLELILINSQHAHFIKSNRFRKYITNHSCNL